MERNIRILKWMWGLIGFLPASAIWILYFSDVGGSLTTGAAVFTIGMLVAGLLDVPTGVFSDLVGRKAGAIAGCASLLLCLVAYGLAQNAWQLFIGALFDGIGMAMLSGNNSALLHESLRALGREDEFATQYGKMQGWSHWSAFVAAIVGSIVATFSLRWTVLIGIPTFLPCVIIGFWLVEPERHVDHAQPLRGHVKAAFGTVIHNRKLGLLVGASMLSGGVSMALYQLRPSWTQALWPVWAIGVARAVSAIFAAIGTWWGGAIINKFGALRSSIVAQLLSSVIDILVLIFKTVVSPAVLTSSSLAFGIGTTADGVLLQSEFTNEQRATLGSIVGVGTRVVYALAALAFGLLANYTTLALALGEVLMIVSAGMYFRVFRPSSIRIRVKKGELWNPSS